MLTKREIEVLRLKQKSLTQKEIAEKLSISQPAVSSFYNTALRKIRDAKLVLNTAKDIGVDENE